MSRQTVAMARPRGGRDRDEWGLLAAAGAFSFLMALLVGVFVLDDATVPAPGGSISTGVAGGGVVPGQAEPRSVASGDGIEMIEVREGDTLRALAGRFAPAADPGAVERRIFELNDLGRGGFEHSGVVAGDVLRVPIED